MFRITEDPLSKSLVQCLAKNYKNDSIVSVDMEVVGVMAEYCDLLCVCIVHCLERVTICCHNTDYVHINRHDRTITVILTKHCTRIPDDGHSVIRNMLEHF